MKTAKRRCEPCVCYFETVTSFSQHTHFAIVGKKQNKKHISAFKPRWVGAMNCPCKILDSLDVFNRASREDKVKKIKT